MTVTVPELVPEASPCTQRAVLFSCWKIFEVNQSSVKKERVFHTQECKMLHSHSAEIHSRQYRLHVRLTYNLRWDIIVQFSHGSLCHISWKPLSFWCHLLLLSYRPVCKLSSHRKKNRIFIYLFLNLTSSLTQNWKSLECGFASLSFELQTRPSHRHSVALLCVKSLQALKFLSRSTPSLAALIG